MTVNMAIDAKPEAPAVPAASYQQIFKSSSLVGGAQAVIYLSTLARTKVIAMLLGPAGIGLVGLYTYVMGLVGALSGLGIGSSGVREVAEAAGSGDMTRVARTVRILRRACWATGLLGWGLTAALAWPLSRLSFGSGERATSLAILGASLFFTSLNGGQLALLQGLRRISDLAFCNACAAIAGSLLAVAVCARYGESGIVPSLIGTAAINLLFSWLFARRVTIENCRLDAGETLAGARRLLDLGVAFMWATLLSGVVALGIRALLINRLGLEANGIYQAAWGVSGLFAGFILGAMGADFYPRLSAIAQDDSKVNRLVNEQTEIGIILALPGLVATLGFAPLIMRALYTTEFTPGAALLPWFVSGVFGRVLSWPLGYVQLAKGASRSYALSETGANVLHVAFVLLLIGPLGLFGSAAAFALMYAIYTGAMLWIVGRLTGFRWSAAVCRLILVSAMVCLLAFLANDWLPRPAALVVGALITLLAGGFSVIELGGRLGRGPVFVVATRLAAGLRLAHQWLFGWRRR